MVPPTDCTEFTETLAECILPQISQIYTETLAEDVLPQIAQIYTDAANFRGCTQTICVDP